MPQAFETVIPDFLGPCKNEICQCHNRHKECTLLKISKSWQASESSIPQVFKIDRPDFLSPYKNQICQCNNATLDTIVVQYFF